MFLVLADLQDRVGEARLIQLTDTSKSGRIGTAKLNRAMTGACSEVQSYAAKRFKVPWTAETVPDVVRERAADLALLKLRTWNGVFTPEDLDERTMLTKWCEDLAAGKVVPDEDPMPPKHDGLVIDKAGKRPSTKDASRAKFRGGIW